MSSDKQLLEEARKRKKEYMRMYQNIELLKLAIARSIATEDFNIKEYKKRIKEKANES